MNLQTYIIWFTDILNLVIGFLLGLAFLFFVVNAIRYFVIQSNSEDGRNNAKNLATYGILGFVFLLVFWGIVNLLSGSLGFAKTTLNTLPCPDFIKGCSNAPENRNSTFANNVDDGFGVGGVDPRPTAGGVPEGIEIDSGYSSSAGDEPPSFGNPTRPVSPGAPTGAEAAFYAEAVARAEAAEEARIAAVREATAKINTLDKVASAQRIYADEIILAYDDRTAPVIIDSIAAITDATARSESQGIAAARLLSNNIITDAQFASFSQAVGFDAEKAKRDATNSSDTNLSSVQEETSESIYNALLFSNRRFLRRESTEEAMSRAEVTGIMNAPAGPERIAKFNAIVEEKTALQTISQQQLVNNLRLQLLSDINAERFFSGKPPVEF